MSAGATDLSAMSDDDLLAALGRGPSAGTSPRPTMAPAQAAGPGALQIRLRAGAPEPQQQPDDLSGMSDEDLLRQLAAPQAPAAPVAPAVSFDQRWGGGKKNPLTSDTDITGTKLGDALRAEADERLVGPPSAENAIDAALFRGANTLGLNIPRNITAGIETLRRGDSIFDREAFDRSYRHVHDVEDALARQNPKSALGGTVGGIVAGALTQPGFSGAATFAGRVGQAAATGAAYGAAAEALDSKDALNTLGAAAGGAAAGGALGGIVEKAAPAVVRTWNRFRPGTAPAPTTASGFAPEAEEALFAAGINPNLLTDGQRAALTQTFAAKGVSPAAIREAQAAELGIPLSRGQASEEPAALAAERTFAAGGRGAGAQQAAQDFATRQGEAVAAARDDIGRRIAGTGQRIDNPAAASEMAAEAARALAGRNAARVAEIERTARGALDDVRGPTPPDPTDAGTTTAEAVRAAAMRARDAYRQGYADVAEIPGTFTPGALDRMGSRVRERIGPEMPVDDVLTPSAVRAIADLDAMPGIFNLAPGDGPNLQQVDQLRKRLVAYRKGASQNPTDRAVMDRILAEFDGHVHDAMDIGLFGQRAAPAPGAPAAGDAAPPLDDFPGFAAAGLPDPSAAAPRGMPETLGQFIARNGGLALTDDARAADLHRWQVGGLQRLAREGGRSMDDLRDELVVAGFLRPDAADGSIARNITDEVMEALRAERQGRPRYRFEDETRAANARGVTDRVADENADWLAQVDRQSRRIAIDMEGYGLQARDLDRGALDDAAAMMLRGEADDAAQAYDRAVANRGQRTEVALDGPPGSDAPFPEPGASGAAAGGSDGFPAGDTSPSDAMKRARALFRDYQRTFRPSGPGDDVGRAMQRIIERDASPGEIATMLYGGSRAGNTGLSVRLADRMKSTLGADSEAWGSVQQGLISRVLDGARDEGAALDHLLTGEGRTLAAKILTTQQRTGLMHYRQGIRAAREAREELPRWVGDLSESGFDPNGVTSALFGAGVPGTRKGSVDYARGLRAVLGKESPQWGALRQAAWMRVAQSAEGQGTATAAREADRVRAFTDGDGAGLARELFNATELAMMRSYAKALGMTVRPAGPGQPAKGGAAQIGRQITNMLAGALGYGAAGPKGAAAALALRGVQKIAEGSLAAREARRSFEGGAPRVQPPAPPPPRRLPEAAGIAAGLGSAVLIPRGQ